MGTIPVPIPVAVGMHTVGMHRWGGWSRQIIDRVDAGQRRGRVSGTYTPGARRVSVAAHHRTAVEASAVAFVDSVGGLYGGATQLGDPGVADGRAGATVAGHRE